MRGIARTCSALALTAGLLTSASDAQAAAIVLGFNSSSLAANDDGSTGSVAIGFDIDFFGTTYSNLFVNNNGNVTFEGPLGTFTPFGLLNATTPIIAPFFADVDTRNAGSDIVRYGGGTFGGNAAFGVNWVNVGYFPAAANLLNSFQLLIVDRPDTGTDNFDFIFNYDQILWETGSASGGSGGCGGSSARAGWSNGDVPLVSFELPGSGVDGGFVDEPSPCFGPAGPFQLTAGMLNSNVAGRYIFEVRNGIVVDPNATVPEPSTVIMLGTGLLVAAGVARRRRRQ